MGLDMAAFRGLTAVPEVRREDAFDQGLLGFHDGEIGAAGFEGMDLSVAYSYEESYEVGMGNFHGVGLFQQTLSELTGHNGDPQSPTYDGPLRALFQARDWIGPLECSAIAEELKRADGVWNGPGAAKTLRKHEWTVQDFADYFAQWRGLFDFAGASGAVNLF